MQRLIIVSNRLPVIVERRPNGLHYKASVGGVATGLKSFYQSRDSRWIGWPGIDTETINGEELSVIEYLDTQHCNPVFISREDVELYYHGFCNRTIWPLFHYYPSLVSYNREYWQAYEAVNRRYANAIAEVAQRDDFIWIHDYQLMLTPHMVREMMPDATIGFFLHIPFPSFEIFRLLPWRAQLLRGMLGANLVGFHTFDYAQHFLKSVQRILGYEETMGQIMCDGSVVKTDVFPMGIDYDAFAKAADSKRVTKEMEKFKANIGNYKVILSVDRLDYTKGIPQRLEAFAAFLEKNPQWRHRVRLILVVVPSRVEVEQYSDLKRRIDELVGSINGQYGAIGFVPIWYLYHSFSFNSLVALYKMSDIALITPRRDGMNLIAKEYLASKTDGKGVLILSETAGAAKELSEALQVNVNNQSEIVCALEDALMTPDEEQIEHNRTMQRRIHRYNVNKWATDFIDSLAHTRKVRREMEAKLLSNEGKLELVTEYLQSTKRLFLLDYDGTLVPFTGKPGSARPNDEVLRLLTALGADPRNQVLLISGRDRDTMNRWFGNLPVSLVAEHGVWTRELEGEWEILENLSNEWKEDVKPVLELYADRTPGSLVEEKEYSLVWHYRRANAQLGAIRARELADDLMNLTSNLNLQVLVGNKVIEIKNSGVSKGQATLRWLSDKIWEFMLCIGDDVTDEDMFRILPQSAWSIKVGLSASLARFNLNSPAQVRALLKELLEVTAYEVSR